jgi:hypothetical protein
MTTIMRFRDALALTEQGYCPIPVRNGLKIPRLAGWQNYCRIKKRDLQDWASDSVGLLCGELRGIDIDVRDEHLAARLEKLADEMLGLEGRAPRRTGQFPKTLLVVRSTKGRKIATAEYRLRGDDANAKTHKVEILGHGQQFVAYGTHPSTKREYQWNGAGDPMTIKFDALPFVGDDKLREFIVECESILDEYGERHTAKTAGAEQQNAQSVGDDVVRDLRSALTAIRADDRDTWVRLGHALKTLGDQGRGLWLEWSSTSDKYDAADAAKKWESFDPRATGYQAVFTEAQAAGWVNPKKGKPKEPKIQEPPPHATEEIPPEEKIPDPTRDHGREKAEANRSHHKITLARDFKVREDLPYFIKGIWQQDTFGVTWGPSGGGKSYVTADMVLHVAAGKTWCGRRVSIAGVVYLGAEGPYSMERRFIVMARELRLDRAGLPLAILSGSLHLLNDPDGVIAAIAEAAQMLRSEFEVFEVMLVIDTMARSAPGMDENGPEDMGRYVGVVDRIRAELGMAVIVVHHAGKDLQRGARGHGALKAAADCEVLIADSQITIEKLRDGAIGTAIPFTLHPVELARDSDGDPITACWVEYGTESTSRAKQSARISPTTTIAFEALREAIRDHGERLPNSSTLPGGKPACSIDPWRQRFYGRIGDRDSEAQKKAFQRAKDDLSARKIIGAWESRVWIW